MLPHELLIRLIVRAPRAANKFVFARMDFGTLAIRLPSVVRGQRFCGSRREQQKQRSVIVVCVHGWQLLDYKLKRLQAMDWHDMLNQVLSHSVIHAAKGVE